MCLKNAKMYHYVNFSIQKIPITITPIKSPIAAVTPIAISVPAGILGPAPELDMVALG